MSVLRQTIKEMRATFDAVEDIDADDETEVEGAEVEEGGKPPWLVKPKGAKGAPKKEDDDEDEDDVQEDDEQEEEVDDSTESFINESLDAQLNELADLCESAGFDIPDEFDHVGAFLAAVERDVLSEELDDQLEMKIKAVLNKAKKMVNGLMQKK